MKNKLLITGVGGPTPRSLAYGLKLANSLYSEISLVGTDSNPLAFGLYNKELFDSTYLIPKAEDPEYWPSIEKIIQDESITGAIILPEHEVLEWAKRQKHQALPVPSIIPPLEAANLFFNKQVLYEALEGTDLVPKFVTFKSDHFNYNEIIQKTSSPFWVRGTEGSSGFGSYKISSERELNHWIFLNQDIREFIASEFLPGRNLACKLLFYQGKLVRSACNERVRYIMSKVAPSGITGNISFGRFLNEPALVEVAKKTVEYIFEKVQLPPHGFFTVDLKEDCDGHPKITEVNIRHIATTYCFAAAGATFGSDTLSLIWEHPTFNSNYKMYTFEEGLAFLRDVDERPILLNEKSLLAI